MSVKPEAKRQSVTQISESEYRVAVHAPPVDGKANRAVIELLSEHFSVPKSSIKIIRGESARKKLIEIG